MNNNDKDWTLPFQGNFRDEVRKMVDLEEFQPFLLVSVNDYGEIMMTISNDLKNPEFVAKMVKKLVHENLKWKQE